MLAHLFNGSTHVTPCARRINFLHDEERDTHHHGHRREEVGCDATGCRCLIHCLFAVPAPFFLHFALFSSARALNQVVLCSHRTRHDVCLVLPLISYAMDASLRRPRFAKAIVELDFICSKSVGAYLFAPITRFHDLLGKGNGHQHICREFSVSYDDTEATVVWHRGRCLV